MTALRQRLLEDMQIRNLSVNTQRSYIEQVSRFARHFGQSPLALGPEEIRAYQVYLTNEKKLAPGSIVIAVSALRFLYKITLKKDWPVSEIIPAPKKPQTLPVVLSPEEVVRFLDAVKNAYLLIQQSPARWPLRTKTVRKCPLEKFPFNVIFTERSETIWIVAVAHTSRRPNYWAKRLKDIP